MKIEELKKKYKKPSIKERLESFRSLDLIQKTRVILRMILPKKVRSAFDNSYVKLTYHLYLGKRYECPFCLKNFRKFLPEGHDVKVLTDLNVVPRFRLNSTCPYCGSTDRERLLYSYFKDKTNLFKLNKRINLLHIAPEKNLQKKLKENKFISYYGADLNSPLATIRLDIRKTKFANDFFDVIVCSHVLEHINEDKMAMEEIYRILKKGGWSILQVPISHKLPTTIEDPSVKNPEERFILFGQKDHVRIYGKDYAQRLKKVGFKVTVDNFAAKMNQDDRKKNLINKEEDIFLCKK
jgi:Methyltransferase domain